MDIVIIEGGFFKRPKAVGKGTSPSDLELKHFSHKYNKCLNGLMEL